jgi:hypothetical protein
MDYGPIVQGILFAIFGALTAAVATVTGPTYNDLFVPQMAPSNAFAVWQGGNVFAQGVQFSNVVLVDLVDPAAVLVFVAVGLLYLLRSAWPRPDLSHLAPRLVLGLLVSNLVLPLTEVLWQLAAAIYPIFYGYGGGAWQSYSNVVGPGGISLSWDNGVLGFVVSLVLFLLVLMLAFLIAFRGALLAVLLVLLPPLTLLWSIPAASSLARRAWGLFIEMTFLPCLVVIPLALAVGETNVLVTLGLFAVALAMPQLMSIAGGSASQLGLPSSGYMIAGGLSRGVSSSAVTATAGAQGGWRGFTRGLSLGRSHAESKGSAALSAASSPLAVTGGASRSTLSAGAGPAGWLAWGAQEGIGRIASRLGQQVGKALPRKTGSVVAARGPGGSEGGRKTAPPPTEPAQRFRGERSGSRGPSAITSSARPVPERRRARPPEPPREPAGLEPPTLPLVAAAGLREPDAHEGEAFGRFALPGLPTTWRPGARSRKGGAL